MESFMIYQKLTVYKLAKELAVEIYKITEKMPSNEIYGLISQITRAAVSIPSNIAEGSSRNSVKDQIRFIEIAYGSLLELSCQLEIAFELNYIDKYQFDNLKSKIKDLSVRLSNYRKSKQNSLNQEK